MVHRKSPPPGYAAASNAPESLLDDLLFVSKTERRPPELKQAHRRSSLIAELQVSRRPNDTHLPRRSEQISSYERVERSFLYSRRYRAPEVAGKKFALLSSRDEIALVVLCADCCRRRTNVGTKRSPCCVRIKNNAATDMPCYRKVIYGRKIGHLKKSPKIPAKLSVFNSRTFHPPKAYGSCVLYKGFR